MSSNMAATRINAAQNALEPIRRTPQIIPVQHLIKPRAGEWVEVASKEEIVRTLDSRGQLDGVPFMPEMFQYCGQRFQIFRRAHKTCDTIYKTGGRRMDDTVHLEGTRCDGSAHGGCDAACAIFWKTAWLKSVDGPSGPKRQPTSTRLPPVSGVTPKVVFLGTVSEDTDEDDPTYVCQATQLFKATKPLKWWDIRQYVEDVRSRNESLATVLTGGAYVAAFNWFRIARRLGAGETWIHLYDRLQKLRKGVPFPRKHGSVPPGARTPSYALELQPGETVRVKPYDQILETLDGSNKNRGLYFDAEEVPYCDKTFRVRSRVNRIIDESTGKMIPIASNTVILDGVYCKGHYSDRRMFCPRSIYSFWRETWLERVHADSPH